MADTHETISDILAEMRLGATGDMPFAYRIGRPDRIVEYKTEDGKKYVQRSTVVESVTIKELADRMESALKRESGNYAKLREVVGDLLYMAERYAGRTPATETVIFDPETKKEVRTINYYAVIEKARSILSGGDEEPKGKKEQNHER